MVIARCEPGSKVGVNSVRKTCHEFRAGLAILLQDGCDQRGVLIQGWIIDFREPRRLLSQLVHQVIPNNVSRRTSDFPPKLFRVGQEGSTAGYPDLKV